MSKWSIQHGSSRQGDHSSPRWSGAGGQEISYTTQHSVQFKTYELFISGIFHLLFSNCSRPQVTETLESETVDNWGLLCIVDLMKYSEKSLG